MGRAGFAAVDNIMVLADVSVCLASCPTAHGAVESESTVGPRKGNLCAQVWFIASRFKQTPLLRLTLGVSLCSPSIVHSFTRASVSSCVRIKLPDLRVSATWYNLKQKVSTVIVASFSQKVLSLVLMLLRRYSHYTIQHCITC